MTRWKLNINNEAHTVEIRYTNNVEHEPEVIVNGRNIDFKKCLRVFRRIYDGKNWRILLQICHADILIRSVKGKGFKMMVSGVPFEHLKKNVVSSAWS